MRDKLRCSKGRTGSTHGCEANAQLAVSGSKHPQLSCSQVAVVGIQSSCVVPRTGSRTHIDQNYALASFPSILEGSVLIKTPYDFKTDTTVGITAPGYYTIYAAVHDRNSLDAGYRSAGLLAKDGWSTESNFGLRHTVDRGSTASFHVFKKSGLTGSTTLPKTTRHGIVVFFVQLDSSMDVCYDPAVMVIRNTHKCSVAQPCGRCEGSCNNDAQCKRGLLYVC